MEGKLALHCARRAARSFGCRRFGSKSRRAVRQGLLPVARAVNVFISTLARTCMCSIPQTFNWTRTEGRPPIHARASCDFFVMLGAVALLDPALKWCVRGLKIVETEQRIGVFEVAAVDLTSVCGVGLLLGSNTRSPKRVSRR